MKNYQEEWLINNTFYCPTLRIKITPEKCNKSRKGYSDEDRQKAEINGISLEDRPPCSICKDWKTYSARVGKSKEDEERYKEHPNLRKIIF